jgi:hypothetical protein
MKNKDDAFNYYKYLQLKALDSIFNPDDLYLQRKICRWYSKEFNTPLDKVLKSPFDSILIHYYETQFEQIPHNDLVDVLIQDHITDLSDENNEELDSWLESLEKYQSKILEAKEKRQSLNNQAVPTVKNQSTTSDQPLQPEDVVMNFRDEDFNDE